MRTTTEKLGSHRTATKRYRVVEHGFGCVREVSRHATVRAAKRARRDGQWVEFWAPAHKGQPADWFDLDILGSEQ
jgi:hypothetical protein